MTVEKRNTVTGYFLQLLPPIILGIIFSITLFDFLLIAFLGVLVSWYIFERIFRTRYPYLPCGPLAPVLFIAMVFLAVIYPKYEDRRIGPFASTSISIQELNHFIHVSDVEFLKEPMMVKLPNKNPTRWEVFQSIEEQTPFKIRKPWCPSGSTILFGYDSQTYVSLPFDHQLFDEDIILLDELEQTSTDKNSSSTDLDSQE